MMPIPDYHLDYNVQGAKHKRLFDAIADYLQDDAAYLRAPAFNYQVDYLVIDRNGYITFDGPSDIEEVNGIVEALAEQGFTAISVCCGAPSRCLSNMMALPFP